MMISASSRRLASRLSTSALLALALCLALGHCVAPDHDSGGCALCQSLSSIESATTLDSAALEQPSTLTVAIPSSATFSFRPDAARAPRAPPA